MNEAARLKLEEAQKLVSKLCPNPSGPLLHTPEDDLGRQALTAMIGLEEEPDNLIIEICDQIKERIEAFELAHLDTWPPESGEV